MADEQQTQVEAEAPAESVVDVEVQLNRVMWRSNTKDTGPDTFVR
jgi:hypothetical protein